MASIAMIPHQVAAGAEVDVTSDTAVMESTGGISGRFSRRQVPMRNFHITVGPDFSAEVRSIFYTHRRRWPVAIRDWSDYTITNEVLTAGTGGYPLQRLIQSTTGTRFFHQRLLVPDETETPMIIKSNGSTLIEGVDWSWTDFGIVSTGAGGTITATGQFMVPCCFMQDALNVKVYAVGSAGPILGLPDVQLREIQEAELIALMAQTDDSV